MQGLDENKLVTFRVGIEVDMTELRRRSLGPLESLGLEAPASSGSVLRPIPNNCSSTTTADTATPVRDDSPPAAMPSKGLRWNNTCNLSGLIQPAFRLQNGGSPTLFVAPGGNPGRRPWNPATSAAVSQMRREGFAVHDVAGTLGGGFYLEPPPLSSLVGRLQGGDTAERESGVGGDDGGRAGVFRDYSENVVFSSGPAAPRFAAFVAGGVQQVGSRKEAREVVLGAQGTPPV